MTHAEYSKQASVILNELSINELLELNDVLTFIEKLPPKLRLAFGQVMALRFQCDDVAPAAVISSSAELTPEGKKSA